MEEQSRPVRWQQVDEPEDVKLEDALPSALAGSSIDPRSAAGLATAVGSGVRRPTVRHHDGLTAFSLRLLEFDEKQAAVESGEEWLLVHGDEVVTVRRRPSMSGAVRARSAGVREVRSVSVTEVLHQVLLNAVKGYERAVDGLSTEADDVELSVFATRRGGDAERIYLLKREVAEARRAVVPLADLLEGPVRDDALLGRWFQWTGSQDLLERLHRTAETVQAMEELLSSVLDAHVARVTVQQNDDMRRISAGAALIVAPTLLAGIWGMNFVHMPELSWIYGYPAALAVMLACVGGMWWAFRRSGWL